MPTVKRRRGGSAGNVDPKELLRLLSALKAGDFTARMPAHHTGLAGKVGDTLNEIIERLARMAHEFRRLSSVVGKEGRIGQRASIGDAGGAWQESVEAVNSLVSALVQPNTEVARVIGAVANGDLSRTMALEMEGRPLTGEFLKTATT